MLAILQFPLADMRRFSTKEIRYGLPPFPGLTGGETGSFDLFRFFGCAKPRAQGCDPAFSDEASYYSAHNALRFVALGRKAFAKLGFEVEPKIDSFRRVLMPSPAVRIEVGVAFEPTVKPVGPAGLAPLLRTILELPTEVPEIGKDVPGRSSLEGVALRGLPGARPLVLQKKALASQLVLATSQWSRGNLLLADKLVRPCMPMLILETRHGEILPRDVPEGLPRFRLLPRQHTRGVDVWFGRTVVGESKIPTWLLAPGCATWDVVRSFRLCLLRLHAELQAFVETLHGLDPAFLPEAGTRAGQDLASYLISTCEILNREEQDRLDQSAIVEAIEATAGVLSETEKFFLSKRLAEVSQKVVGKPLSCRIAERSRIANTVVGDSGLEKAPDLTVTIRRPLDSTALLWTFSSPHSVILPNHEVSTDIGDEPDRFAQGLMDEIEQKRGSGILKDLIYGLGTRIAEKVPDELWALLREIVRWSRPPKVLFLSEEAFVPWELALMEPPLDPSAQPFLGAQAIVGRWVISNKKRPLPVPEVQIRSAALVAGEYGATTPTWKKLPEAVPEVKDIAQELMESKHVVDIRRVNAVTEEVRDCLKHPDINLLHFAVHGRFNRQGLVDGLLLADGQTLPPNAVRGNKLRGKPFVFLNACQVGQGNQVLGGYAGLPEAFLTAGASAVVAPLWSVDDKIAHNIAQRLYEEALGLPDGPDRAECVAEVLRSERARFNPEEDPTATCLSYQFFGHPELRLRAGL